jgi:hypothetical protein
VSKIFGVVFCSVAILYGAYGLIDPLGLNRLRYWHYPPDEREERANSGLWAVSISSIPIMVIASYMLLGILGWFR